MRKTGWFAVPQRSFALTQTSWLSEEEASRRLEEEGPNELPTSMRRGVMRLLAG
jgi:magnesium-transporting ATPase (P-type)